MREIERGEGEGERWGERGEGESEREKEGDWERDIYRASVREKEIVRERERVREI